MSSASKSGNAAAPGPAAACSADTNDAAKDVIDTGETAAAAAPTSAPASASTPEASTPPPSFFEQLMQNTQAELSGGGGPATSAGLPRVSIATNKNLETNGLQPHLPVLIIPGFMSSGLQVQQSKLEPSWEGKRLWLNLVSLGMGDFFSGSANDKLRRLGDPNEDGDDDDSEEGGGDMVNNTEHSPRNRRASALLAREASTAFFMSNRKLPGGVEEAGQVEQEAADQHLAVHRSNWLSHMGLMEDMKSEHPDVEVRAMEGLAGVDYLTPGTLTNHLSYVFGPVIDALKKVGFEEGVNLDAVPYDWRLPPSELERRDQYFTRTMRRIEEMYEKNGGMPVVLVCHSLGTKTGHYLLDFAHSKDKEWCHKYVHTYMPVGAPHLGAPKAMRGSITGDKMGLEAFLNDHQALAMGRSFGSAPWLIPAVLPSFAPSTVYVRREGAFEICIKSTIDVGPLLDDRIDLPEKLELMLRHGNKVLKTKFSPIENHKVTFEGRFIFATGPDGPFAKQCCKCCSVCCQLRCACCPCCSNNNLIIYLGEPGLRVAKGTKKGAETRRKCCSENDKLIWLKIFTCWYIVKWFFIAFGYLVYFVYYRGWIKLGDLINRAADRTSLLAASEPIKMEEFVGDVDGHTVDVELRNDFRQTRCCKKAMPVIPTITINVKWIPPEIEFNRDSKGCQVAELPKSNTPRRIGELSAIHYNEEWEYDACSGYDILKKEGFDNALKCVSNVYDADPFEPRSNGLKAPPVKNIKAVYGINLPTEVGAVYRRRKAVVEKKNKVVSLYTLDRNAKGKLNDGLVLENGVLKETPDTPQILCGPTNFRSSALAKEMVLCSGDGTVPYWSLQHVRTWERQCNVSVTELDGAEHREILNDKRFHRTLVDYVTTKEDAAEKQV